MTAAAIAASLIFFTLNTIVKKHKCISLIRIASVEGKLQEQKY